MMILYFSNLSMVESIFFVELLILGLVTLFSMTLTLFFRYKDAKHAQKVKELSKIFNVMIAQKVDNLSDLVPKRLLFLPVVLDTLENFEKKISGTFWNHLKEEFIHSFFEKDLLRHLQSRDYLKLSQGLRALILAPSAKLASYAISSFKNKRPLLRFIAADCCIRIGTEKTIKATLQAMSQERPTCQYAYRDGLMSSNEEIHAIILKEFNQATEEKFRISCLKILSTKMGYLSLASLQNDLHSPNPELRWWATRALINCPSEKTSETLIKLIEDPDIQIQALALFHLGTLKIPQAIPFMQKTLYSPHYWVRFHAAFALKELGEDGLKILKDPSLEKDQNAYAVAKFIVDLPVSPFSKDIQEYDPEYQPKLESL